MSEKYVKDILEKLEEIEKLHSKLRTLVPRVRNQEAGKVSSVTNLPKNKNEPADEESNLQKIPEAFRNLRKSSKANVRKLFTIFGRDWNVSTKNPKDNKWGKLRSNTADFAKKHWQDKKEKVKNLLSTVIERDIILVNRAAQTDNELGMNPSVKIEEKTEFSKSDQPKKRKHSVQDQLERLLEHFNYSRDADVTNENRVSTHRSGNGPRRVEKLLSFPDEHTETLKIVTSAEKVCIDKKIS